MISLFNDFLEDSERSNSVKERMKKFASATAVPKCSSCDRSVYANDPQIVLDGLSYHRACAKCVECKCQITIQNFNKSGSTLYCTTHYLKRFHEDGTILGSEKFTHQSAPGKFAGSGFTIPISNETSNADTTLPPAPESQSTTTTTTTETASNTHSSSSSSSTTATPPPHIPSSAPQRESIKNTNESTVTPPTPPPHVPHVPVTSTSEVETHEEVVAPTESVAESVTESHEPAPVNHSEEHTTTENQEEGGHEEDEDENTSV